MTLTREPSASRASTMGDDSSTRRPTDDTMRSITRRRCSSEMKCTLVRSRQAGALDVDVVAAIDHHLADGRVVQELLERAESHDVAGDVLGEELALLRGQCRFVGPSAR